MSKIIVLIFLLPVAGFGAAEASPPNWGGKYSPCNRHADLLSREHVDLGVRISTSNPVLAQQFAKAMEFWTGVLDFEWHEDDTRGCAIQLVDGTPALFDFCVCMSAKSQFPDRADFQGWIAFNPRFKLTEKEMFLDSVHEIGHLLGLRHNPSDHSVMFYFGVDKVASLDAADLDALAAQHNLRAQKGGIKEVRVIVPGETGGRGSGSQGSAWWKRHFQSRTGGSAASDPVRKPAADNLIGNHRASRGDPFPPTDPTLMYSSR